MVGILQVVSLLGFGLFSGGFCCSFQGWHSAEDQHAKCLTGDGEYGHDAYLLHQNFRMELEAKVNMAQLG